MRGITASITIREGFVLKDGKILFENKGSGLGAVGEAAPGAGKEGVPGVVEGTAPGAGDKSSGLGDFLLSLYRHFGLNYPRFYKMDSLSKLGWLASELLLGGSFNAENYRPEEVGIVLSNAHSSLDTDRKYFETVQDIPSPSLFVYTLPSIMIGEICIRNNFKGESAFFVSERYDAGFIEGYVRGLMDDDVLRACIYGWVDLLGEEGEAMLFLVGKENR